MNQKVALAELRKRRHISQKQLSEALNLSAGAIGMYETGRRRPSLSRAIEIANYFNVPVETISFCGKGKKV